MKSILSLSTIVITICTAIALGAGSSAPKELTREWLFEGAEFPERRDFPLDPKVGPCEDLYEHACNIALSKFTLREDRSVHSFAFSDHRERLLHAKRKYLSTLNVRAPKSAREGMLKNNFAACMDEKASAAEERELVDAEIRKVLAIPDKAAFMKFLGERIDQPFLSFVGFDTIPNQKNPRWNDVILTADIASLPEPTYYKKEDVVADLQTLAKDFFTEIKAVNPETQAKWVVEMESEFAKTQPLPAETRKRLTAKDHVDKKKISELYPELSLTRFVGRIPAKTQLRNFIPESMKGLQELLKTRPLEQIKALYLFHEVTGFMDDAYPEFYKKKFEFNRKHMGGPEKRPVREERCTKMMMSQFEREIDAELLPILFPNFPREKVVALGEKIREAILAGLDENTWLSPSAKKAAKLKMKTARLLLVSPTNDGEWNFNPPGEYSPTKPYENKRTWAKLKVEKEIKELSEERNRSRWEMGPLSINAYYMSMDNVFVLPIGILQYPFYDPSSSEIANFGGIGMVVGHELGHGIDDNGSQYNEVGEVKNWMTKKDLNQFKARGEKFIARFNAIGHDGKLTLGENIGDHVGLTFAYAAAFDGNKSSKEDKQAFFLQFARSWCLVARPKYREMLLKTDPHAMGEARVNEQVKHLSGFYEAFACKPGDKMYLAEKDRIRVW